MRQLGIYVGFQSPSIIRYLSPETGDMFTAHITMCEFDETTFPKLGSGDDKEDRTQFDFVQSNTKEGHRDPYTGQGEKEVRRILHLHRIAQSAPDAFAATERITRSSVNEATNYPARVPVNSTPAFVAPPQNNKRGRPKGSKDLVQRKRRTRAELLGETVDIGQPAEHPGAEEGSMADSSAEVNLSASLTLKDDEADPKTLYDCKS